MQENHSPLRYPGGKANIIDTVIPFVELNNLSLCHYAEPFAGGCGLALGLLMRGYVSQIYINDIDQGIWAFWHSVLNHNEEFIKRIWEINIHIDEWHRQREIIRNPEGKDILDLGFATFFMNRTNRSGIIKAGVIGGLKQDGKYLLDCRFNKSNLSRRIERIGMYAEKIHLSKLDALIFLDEINNLKHSVLIGIDPPYYRQGSSLYTNFYNETDHKLLATTISALKKPWFLTYDNEPQIKDLYKKHRINEFNLNYSVQTKRIGTELMVFSDNLVLPAKETF